MQGRPRVSKPASSTCMRKPLIFSTKRERIPGGNGMSGRVDALIISIPSLVMLAKARNPYYDVEQLDSKPAAAECYLSVALLGTATPASRHQEMANVSSEGHGLTWPLL